MVVIIQRRIGSCSMSLGVVPVILTCIVSDIRTLQAKLLTLYDTEGGREKKFIMEGLKNVVEKSAQGAGGD